MVPLRSATTLFGTPALISDCAPMMLRVRPAQLTTTSVSGEGARSWTRSTSSAPGTLTRGRDRDALVFVERPAVEHHHVGAGAHQPVELVGGDARRAARVLDELAERLARHVDAGEQLEAGRRPGRDAAVEHRAGRGSRRAARTSAARSASPSRVVAQHDAGARGAAPGGRSRSSSRLSGTERANSRWLCEKISSSRTSSERQLLAVGEHRLDGVRAQPRCMTAFARLGAIDAHVACCGVIWCTLPVFEIEAHAIDLVEIGAGHADEARVVGIVDRMDRAVLVDAGVAGQQAVLLDRLELGLLGIAAVVLALPFDHVGVMGGLAVDRPGGAMIVRRRHPRLVVDVGENLEAELGVLVEHLQPARHMLAAIFLDEVLVRRAGARACTRTSSRPAGPGSRLRMARQSDMN